jgi:hypothetical protein
MRLVALMSTTDLVTASSPLLGSKGPANLPLENYSHGPTAPYNSWCLLQKEE